MTRDKDEGRASKCGDAVLGLQRRPFVETEGWSHTNHSNVLCKRYSLDTGHWTLLLEPGYNSVFPRQKGAPVHAFLSPAFPRKGGFQVHLLVRARVTRGTLAVRDAGKVSIWTVSTSHLNS